MLDTVVLVRMLFDGYEDRSAFERGRLAADATLNFTEFGYFGLSLWAVSDFWPLERILTEKGRYSRYVALYRAADLRGAGLAIIPSGRLPHYDASAGLIYGRSFGQVGAQGSRADELVDRFVAATYTGVQNYFFTPRSS